MPDLFDIEELKNKIDIAEYISRYVDLKFNGREYVGLCPFHREVTPSFTVSPEKRAWFCFGCSERGDIIDFVRKYHNVKLTNAIDMLCVEYNIVVKPLPSIIKMSKKFATREDDILLQRVYLSDDCMDDYPDSNDIREWRFEGVSDDVLAHYNVRYDREHTGIFFPVRDASGGIVAIKRRTLDPDFKEHHIPKYIHLSKVKPKDFFFGYYENLQFIEDKSEIIILESEKSVMKMESFGIRNTVAVGSHDMTPQQIDLLIGGDYKNVVIAYDDGIERREILKQCRQLKRYKNVFVMLDYDGLLQNKESPADTLARDEKIWYTLYGGRRRI